MRHLHLTNEYFKYFSQIVLSFAKAPLIENMSIFQIACKPNHRPSEHIYVIRSIIAYYIENKKGLIVTGYDLKKYYDSEQLLDCLYNSSLKGKVYRLMFEMNKKSRIKVKTPVGLTTSEETGPVVAQGKPESGILSSVNLDKDVDVTFKGSDCEIRYYDTPLAPILYMDDIFRMAVSVKSAQDGNNLIEHIVNSKGLELNLGKSNFILIGSKKARRKLKLEVDQEPLSLCNQPMEEVKITKFLGDYFSFNLED